MAVHFCIMILIIVISFFIALLLWLLFVPVTLFLNTDTSRYHLVLPGIFKAVMIPSAALFDIRVWIFFIPIRFNPFQGKIGKTKEKPRKSWRKWSLKKFAGGRQIISDAALSIRIRKLSLDIDTDDFMLNAWLVPVFSLVNSGDIQMRVNFEGTSSLLLDLRFRLGTLLWIVIKNKYRSFINL
jgi:hypothetical protein